MKNPMTLAVLTAIALSAAAPLAFSADGECVRKAATARAASQIPLPPPVAHQNGSAAPAANAPTTGPSGKTQASAPATPSGAETHAATPAKAGP